MLETPEQFLSHSSQMRRDLEDGPGDPEWVILRHTFCFISHQMTEFKAYWAEVKEKESGAPGE